MKKVVCLCACIIVLIASCIPVYASAEVYSNLPEPQIIHTGWYSSYSAVAYITDSFNNYQIFTVTFPEASDPSGISVTFDKRSDGSFNLNITNASTEEITYYYYRYAAVSGAVYSNFSGTVNALSTRNILGSPVHITKYTPYGITLTTTSYSDSKQLCSIAWSDATDPETYTKWLQDIYTRDGNILQDLEIFYNAFDTFRQVNHSDLTNIYSLLSDIYDLLGGGEVVSESSTVDTSEYDEYNEIEESLLQDKTADLESIADFDINFADDVEVDTSPVVITATGSAIPFINQLLSKFVLGNNAVLPMVIMSLTMGIFVLIIGRKISK